MMFEMIEALTQEVKDQEARHKNATKELRKTIQEQNAKISQLEDELQNRVNPIQTNSYSQAMRSGLNDPQSEDMGQRIQSQMEQISATLNDHQKLREMKERESRAKNLVIVGIPEERNKAKQDTTTQFLKEKLDLNCETSITDVKRLGEKLPNRLILISLNSPATKKSILAKHSSLAGTNIYINHDLTRDQMKHKRELRETKKRLLQLPRYSGKKIYIYQGKLYVERKPVPEAVSHSNHQNRGDARRS